MPSISRNRPTMTQVPASQPAVDRPQQSVPNAPNVSQMPTPGAPVPTPYPNLSRAGFEPESSQKVKMGKKAVVNQKSQVAAAMGDEPGIQGGIASGKAIPTIPIGDPDKKPEK